MGVVHGNIHIFEELCPELDPDDGVAKNPRFVDRVAEEVIRRVAERLKKGNVALTLGSDHSTKSTQTVIVPSIFSYDVDALNPTVVPTIGTPVRGGLTFREGHYICEALCETYLIVAVDCVKNESGSFHQKRRA
ncbi:Arginase, catabolizes arginine to ornithine and urea [Massospora cicadina]|nr:Arginase, catabolizes arginine to ornithine and urea [Massospora cicadina]